MKETACPLCGKEISISEKTTYKQHVLCPYCNGKFSYLVDSAEFSSERLAYAIETCQKNSVDSRYYGQAPAGARMYIGLLFYGKVFKGGMDANLYLAAMRKVEPQLKKRDWQYLLENESDRDLAAYYRDRMEVAHAGPSSAMLLHVSDFFKPDTRTVQGAAVPRAAKPEPERQAHRPIPIRCPLCGKGIKVGDDIAIGQHISCPYCEGKFSYSKDCAEKGDGESSGDLKEMARGKDRRDAKRKKRERKRIAALKLVSYGCFMAFIVASGVVFAYRQWTNRQEHDARIELALLMSDNSQTLSDWHSRYSASISECKGDVWIVRNRPEAAEKLRGWINKAQFIQSDIKRVIHDFSETATHLEAMDLYALKLTKSDFEEQMQNLTRRVKQFGFAAPNVYNVLTSDEGAPAPVDMPTTEQAAEESTDKHVSKAEPPPEGSHNVKPTAPVLSERERLQARVDGLMRKLRELNYGFDPDSLKQCTLQEQKAILEEMVYDAEMFQKKNQ